MLENKKIGVVVPCYNEEKHISQVIATMPSFVDKIIVVDDVSKDRTREIILLEKNKDPERILAINHEKNQGVGAAIVSGYKQALAERLDAVAVMAGDAQMDPEELIDLFDPVIKGGADYSKGNRLIYGDAWNKIPKARYLGNSVLSLLTKIASGYWHVADSQTGYTVISGKALSRIDLEKIYKRYGFPNDLLVRLNVISARLKEIPIKPIYHQGGVSGIRYWKVIPTISLLLTRLFFWRLWLKYVVLDFHPLVFFYFASLILLPVGFVLGVYLIYSRFASGAVASPAIFLDLFLIISGIQFLLFAMWFDMDYNRDLKIK